MNEVAETAISVVERRNDVETVPDETVDLVEEDLLVEEVSIDGMCGVY